MLLAYSIIEVQQLGTFIIILKIKNLIHTLKYLLSFPILPKNSDEQQQDEPLFVYSYQTQQYLRRRVWRTLKALAQSRGADYINMATAVLLEYSDTDTPPAIRSSFDK